MQYECSTVAGITLELKGHYRKLLSSAPGYGSDKLLTKDIDSLGLLIKELEDAIVVLQIKSGNKSESAPDERVQSASGQINERLLSALVLP